MNPMRSLAAIHTATPALRNGFSSNRRKKTCPDCRSVIVQQPTPSYIIKELVLIFVARSELLPDGETSDEHNQWVNEEAVRVSRDKENVDPNEGGLFKGMFKPRGLAWRDPIHDRSDNVTRCPYCHWELEDGYCNSCDEIVDPSAFSEFGDSDFTDDDLDHELDAEDATAVFGADGQDYLDGNLTSDDAPSVEPFDGGPGYDIFGHPRDESLPGRRPRETGRAGSARRPINLWSSEGEEDSEDENDERDSLPDFVVNDDEVAYVSSNDGEETDVPSTNRSRNAARRGPPVVISDDEDDAATTTGAPSESIEDSDSDEPTLRGRQQNKRSRIAVRERRALTLSSDGSLQTKVMIPSALEGMLLAGSHLWMAVVLTMASARVAITSLRVASTNQRVQPPWNLTSIPTKTSTTALTRVMTMMGGVRTPP